MRAAEANPAAATREKARQTLKVMEGGVALRTAEAAAAPSRGLKGLLFSCRKRETYTTYEYTMVADGVAWGIELVSLMGWFGREEGSAVLWIQAHSLSTPTPTS